MFAPKSDQRQLLGETSQARSLASSTDLVDGQDWSETIAPEKREQYDVFEVNVEEDLDSVLAKQGVKAEDIKVIVISRASRLPLFFTRNSVNDTTLTDGFGGIHWVLCSPQPDHHFDHCGTTRLLTFPNARVIVGPETRNKIYAVETHGNVTELSWHHSPTHVATFEHSYDVWGDGSFLVVATPGHTAGHVAGLVRTADSPEAEYLLLGGDCCHSGLLLHPTPEHAHLGFGRWRETGEPLTEPPQHSMHEDLLQAEFSFERVKAAEKRDEVMVVLAHDKRRWELWGGPKATTTGIELAGWRKKGMKR